MINANTHYPLIKLSTIKRVVNFFSKGLIAPYKKTIYLFLEIIHFVMISALIYFDMYSYEYNRGDKKEQGLAIGVYESSFL